MKMQCDYCGKEFNAPPSRLKHRQHIYCSHECYRQARSDKVTLQCDFCGKAFERPRHRIRDYDHQYCNQECYRKAGYRSLTCNYCGRTFKRKASRPVLEHCYCSEECFIKLNRSLRVQVACKYCGKEYEVTSSVLESRNHFYCSQECRGKGQQKRIIATCEYCGTEIVRRISQLNKRSFCDSQCKARWQSEYLAGENNPFWKGGWEPYYGPNWRQQRRRARKRDNFQCRMCGTSQDELDRKLDVHHLIPFRQFGLDNFEIANCLANLRSLCSHCHQELEQLSPREQVRRIHRPR